MVPRNSNTFIVPRVSWSNSIVRGAYTYRYRAMRSPLPVRFACSVVLRTPKDLYLAPMCIPAHLAYVSSDPASIGSIDRLDLSVYILVRVRLLCARRFTRTSPGKGLCCCCARLFSGVMSSCDTLGLNSNAPPPGHTAAVTRSTSC